ncbi:MAG: hypothetical protein V1874_16255 [Spirochaetota bacterium]
MSFILKYFNKPDLHNKYAGSLFIKKFIMIILFFAFSCNQNDLWKNEITGNGMPDVTITNVISTIVPSQITLEWTEPAGDYDQIHVSYSGAATGDSYLASTGTGTGTYTLTSVTIGDVYTFTIRTVKGSSESAGVIQNGAYGIFFVSPTGTSGSGGGWFDYAAYNEPQEAIEDARACSIANGNAVVYVWIMAGRYIPSTDTINGWPNISGTLDTERHFCMRPYVQIYGGFAGTETAPAGRAKSDRDSNGTAEAWEFANETIFDGDLDNDDTFNTQPDGSGAAATTANGYRISAGDNAQCVINNSGIILDNSAVLNGITITGGASATYSGGAINNASASPTIEYCVIRQNNALSGGGVYEASSRSIFRNSFFKYNSASDGGAVFSFTTVFPESFVDCTFDHNYANDQGGAVRSSSVNYLLFQNCLFSHSNAVNAGGVTYSNYAVKEEYTNCTFSKSSSNWGGTCYASGNFELLFTGCTFVDSVATTNGGCVYSYNNSLREVYTNCSFTDNSAQGGAAIYIYGGKKTTVIGCTFRNNSASVFGGAICNYITDNTIATLVSNSIFDNNSAGNGGSAIYLLTSLTSPPQEPTTAIISSSFIRNRITSIVFNFGGAIYHEEYSTYPHHFFLINSLLFRNDSADTSLTTPSGLVLYTENTGTTTYLYNNILWKNLRNGSTGSNINGEYQIYETNSLFTGQHLVHNSIVYATGTPGNLTDSTEINFSGNSSNDSDPQFINESGFDLHLGSSGPATNTGDPAAYKETGTYPINVDLNSNSITTDDLSITGAFTDLDGNERRLGSEVDRGPYEFVE